MAKATGLLAFDFAFSAIRSSFKINIITNQEDTENKKNVKASYNGIQKIFVGLEIFQSGNAKVSSTIVEHQSLQ